MTFNPLEDSEDALREKARLLGPPQGDSEDDPRRRLGAKDVDEAKALRERAMARYEVKGSKPWNALGDGAPEPNQQPQPVAEPTPQRNPFMVALVVFTSLSALTTIIFYIVSVSATGEFGQPDTGTRLIAAGGGSIWLGFTIFLFVGTMILGGVTWKRPE